MMVWSSGGCTSYRTLRIALVQSRHPNVNRMCPEEWTKRQHVSAKKCQQTRMYVIVTILPHKILKNELLMVDATLQSNAENDRTKKSKKKCDVRIFLN